MSVAPDRWRWKKNDAAVLGTDTVVGGTVNAAVEKTRMQGQKTLSCGQCNGEIGLL